MRLNDLLDTHARTLSLEFFPAKTESGWEKWEGITRELAALKPDFMTVTYGAGGSTKDGTKRGVCFIQDQLRIPAVAHLTCVGASRAEIKELLDEYSDVGIINLLALRGDPPKGQNDWQPHPDGCHYASELLEIIAEFPQLSAACAAFPEGHPESAQREQDWRHLNNKFHQGATLGITQAFFDAQYYIDMTAYLQETFGEVPRIVPGILPVQSWSWAQNFVEKFCPNTALPPALREALEPLDGDPEASKQAGMTYTLQLCRDLLAAGAPGLHVYSLNKAEDATQIIETLRQENLL